MRLRFSDDSRGTVAFLISFRGSVAGSPSNPAPTSTEPPAGAGADEGLGALSCLGAGGASVGFVADCEAAAGWEGCGGGGDSFRFCGERSAASIACTATLSHTSLVRARARTHAHTHAHTHTHTRTRTHTHTHTTAN